MAAKIVIRKNEEIQKLIGEGRKKKKRPQRTIKGIPTDDNLKRFRERGDWIEKK